MPYIYVRNEDKVVIGVREDQLTPNNATEYVGDWVMDNTWVSFKIIRNDDGTFTNTGILHPDDNDGLI